MNIFGMVKPHCNIRHGAKQFMRLPVISVLTNKNTIYLPILSKGLQVSFSASGFCVAAGRMANQLL